MASRNSDQQQDDTSVISICGTEVGDDSLLSGSSGLDPDASNSETGSRDERQGKNVASSLLFSAMFSTEEDNVTDVEESAIRDFKQQKNLGSRTDLLDYSPLNQQFARLGRQLSHTKNKSSCYTTQTVRHRVTSVKSPESKDMLHSKTSNTTSLQHAEPKMIPRIAPVNSVGHRAFQNISSSIETSQEKPYKLSSAEKSVSAGINGHDKSFSNMSSNGHREFRNGSVHIMGMLPPLENQGACWNLATDCYMAAVSNLSFAHNEQPGGGKMLRKRQHEERGIVTNQSISTKKSKTETSKEPIFTSLPISISQQSDCQSASVEKKNRYDKTAAALQQSGLMDITIKTAELLRKNAALQKELQKLKQETSLFLQSVLNNPENEALRNFLKLTKQQLQQM